uniref:Tudor domain-containing protein n=1 Tax=Setaria digitata TaxID=48799 RepID=A0A915Q1J8_9BILA
MRFAGKFLVAAPPDGRALWLRHDGSSIHLMASTYFIPAGLVLPVDDCFEVRVLRVDRVTKCLYVRPICDDDQYDELKRNLSAAATDDAVESSCRTVSQPLSMSNVYMVRTEKGYLRGVLLKREKTMTCSMYGIDLGGVYDVSVDDVRELLPSLRDVPPLCFCIVLESCGNTKCEEFTFFEEGTVYVIKICNEFPSNYPQRAKEMYPPAIMSQMYGKRHGKFDEITCTMILDKIPESRGAADGVEFLRSVDCNITYASIFAESAASRKGISISGMSRRRCRALVVKSASVPAITRGPALPFMYQKFNVSLPARLTARVTERTDYDTYLMRNSQVLDDLKKRLVTTTTPLIPRLCLDRGICCMARLIRPARSNCSTFQPQIYRAIASHYRPDDKTCEVLLVDYGQTIVCSVMDLFELQDQVLTLNLNTLSESAPNNLESKFHDGRLIMGVLRLPVEVLEKPMASFRCRVKRFSPNKKNSSKGIRLLDENDYNVCLTLKCASDLYWAKVTLSNTDFVLYYKKPRVHKEMNGKYMKEETNVTSQMLTKNFSDFKSIPVVDVVRELAQRKEELHDEEERLCEQEEMLRKEKEYFTNESIKREQELQLIALQMQLCDISAKLDMVTSNNNPGFMKTNTFCPQLQQSNYCGVPACAKNGYGQPEVGYNNVSNAISMPQQQQNVTINQPWVQQWPYSLPAPPTIPAVAQPISRYNRQYQTTSTSMRSSVSYTTDTPVSFSNPANDYFGSVKYGRNMIESAYPQKCHFSSKKWHTASGETTRTVVRSDTSSDSNNGGHPGMVSSCNTKNIPQQLLLSNSRSGKRSIQLKATTVSSKTSSVTSNSSADCKISASADSFWDSCHRKLEYGEPPHRTISDYCNIAKKQPKRIYLQEFQDTFPERSLSAGSQYDKNLLSLTSREIVQLKLKRSRKAVGTESDSSRKGRIPKSICISGEPADYNQLCVNTKNYEEQEVPVSTERELFLHTEKNLQLFPTYQVYHKLVSIMDGSELVVRRIGSDCDWPVFFVTLNTTLHDISIEDIDSLNPMQKLDTNEIRIGMLCAVRCNDFEKTKVRGIIERLSDSVVHVRHIDDGHIGTIQRDELWSIENLSPNIRTQPALAVPCILASLNDTLLVKAICCRLDEVPGVGQLMRILFKKRRDSDGIWIVELVNGISRGDAAEMN